ncbi:TonB-dependent receptor [Nitrosomonas sp. Nm34]|uniref:TonB-dependent receptor domain-containing protein n=1 Tax=Nitrosomonas sp. Nm34 TaxID=1881055 RepID=UPI0008E0EC28|nr:TonB-dependent receptor [Nitrosomonas sp. Nm34]SFI68325.1 Tetratricopeptide repeat-containing protein [Nitrosomonas sp. Nm34]
MRATASTALCPVKAARIVSFEGIVELSRVGEQRWQRVESNEELCLGDMLRVRSHSRASIRLSNDSMLRLDQKTTITFAEPEDKKNTWLDLVKGKLHIITRTPQPFKIRTPFFNAGVDGTEFYIGVEEDEANVLVYEGKVAVSNDQGSLVLADHEAASILKDQAPRKEGVIRPIDAVQWALYYPTIIDYRPDEKIVAKSLQLIWRTSVEHYRRGRLIEALSVLDQIDPQQLTTPLLIYRAELLLSVGRVDEAKANIEQAIQLQPGNNDGYALQAVIAVVQNDKESALSLANQAIELDRTSPTARLALSYAKQAHFKIEEALSAVEEAIRLDAKNALVWARLSELHLSTGYLDRALEAAQVAVSLNPNLGKTQTVLGFVHLLTTDTEKAKVVFTQAIQLDQADPLPRLGLGLALIREGKLEAGRIEIEIAASLDPANSLLRSYLGKAYFEEKRYPLASTQFDLAKERDPNDPTPWFYDAIQQQTQNQPVEALRDIQKSIQLNDNRAVYRSKLLLDQDQAARGSSLARIYDNLGFEKRALMETARSLSLDPANHSAHRFLSDAYVNIPRYEIARVSELLQAQLLQPVNINPVQPHLAVADLNIITTSGPVIPGFNEFAPLMERNRPQLVASGIFGSNSTLGDEVVASAVYDRASVSLGQFHFDTNGFKRNKPGEANNNDQTHNIYNAFMQYAFNPKFNVQVELRTRATEQGDLTLDFNPKNYDSSHRRKLSEEIARIGARYALSPNQDLIFSGKYIDRSEIQNFGNFYTDLENKGFQIEAQHILRAKNFNSIIGGSGYRFDNNSLENGIEKPSNELERESAYIYTNTNFLPNINATLALSYDSFSNTLFTEKVDKFNPKFGLQWNITNSVRLRATWLEATKSHLIAQQSLEPTQVAGFNQFFDDINGTRSRRMGVGLDTHFTNRLYSGIEISERKLEVPIRLDPTVEHLQKQNEQLYRAYLYWIFNSNWAIKGEMQFEKFNRNHQDIAMFSNDPDRIQTLSLPITINYFNPHGFFFNASINTVKQNLRRKHDFNDNQKRNPENPIAAGSGIDTFFLLDSIIGYRFPNRRGIFTLEGRNLLNDKFFYRNIGFNTAEAIPTRYVPERTFFVRLTLNF